MCPTRPLPSVFRAVALLAPLGLAGTGLPVRADSSPFDDCEAVFAAAPQDWKACGCFYRVASGGTELRGEAVARLEAHRASDPANPCIARTLGRFRLEDGRAEEAAALFEHAASEYRARGLADGEVYARLNLSNARAQSGAAGDQIVAELARAREVAEAAENPILEAEVAVKEAKLLLLRGGNLDLAEASLLEAYRTIFPEAHPTLKKDILANLATILYRRGDFDRAETKFGDLAELAADSGLHLDEAQARINRAVAASAASLPTPERREDVIRLFEEALATARRAGHPFAEIEARKRLGRLIGGAEGRAHLETALTLAERYRDRAPEQLAGVLSASAMDLLDEDPVEARRRVDQAFGLLAAVDDPWSQVYGWANRLRVLWATAPRDEALAAALSTLEIADRLGTLQETQERRAEVDSVWSEIYLWLSGRLLTDAASGGGAVTDPESLDTAFSVTERMRARLLLEALSAAGVDSAREPVAEDPEIQAAWREVQGEIVAVHRRLLQPGLPIARRRELTDELDDLSRREERLSLRRRQSRSTTVDGADQPVGLAEVQADLAPNEAVLAFQMGLWEALDGSFTGGAWLVAVTRDEVRAYRLPGRSEIGPQIEVFLGLFARRDGSETSPAAALYDTLLRDALDSLPESVERLVIVPDGPLHRLPFATLRKDPEAPPLSARYELFVTPSTTVWSRLKTHQGDAEDTLDLALALADPTTPGGTPAAESVPATARFWSAGLRLASLPHARREGRAALHSLGDPGRLLLGPDATERAVKEGAGHGLRLLHFGTHAILDEKRPQLSAVVLAAGAEDEDGLLRPPEAAELDLDGAVVVLAACQSSTGTVLQGEGALSLARAFIEGGAGAVVGTLWPVEDEEAAELLESFYRHLGQGDTVARALASAQREAVEAGAPAAAWAAWTVLGNGAVIVPGGRPRGLAALGAAGRLGWAWATLLALALTVGGLVLARRIGLRRRA